jgi:hypothetical protein
VGSRLGSRQQRPEMGRGQSYQYPAVTVVCHEAKWFLSNVILFDTLQRKRKTSFVGSHFRLHFDDVSRRRSRLNGSDPTVSFLAFLAFLFIIIIPIFFVFWKDNIRMTKIYIFDYIFGIFGVAPFGSTVGCWLCAVCVYVCWKWFPLYCVLDMEWFWENKTLVEAKLVFFLLFSLFHVL